MRIEGVRDVAAKAVDSDSPAASREASADFGARLHAAIADLETTAVSADATTEGLVTGEVDIHEAMVAMEKADLVLRVAGTVRNKVIEAYQQLMQASGG
jgi:flagellar hook-basal body complex protein FliE